MTQATAAAFRWPLRVYWEDTDAGGVVFYANYLKFFERARTEWLRTLGIDQSWLLAEHGCMFVVQDTALRYHAPARLDDELTVVTTLEEQGRARLGLAQQALRGSALLCDGRIRIACVTQASFKPSRIPPGVLDKLKP
ncbi:MAG: tol-pal system-associated acyl-CoA thioesterase [Betaproteobacteria bacterium]|nr:tol-pal system-associated acyl-CoA thioesterase [Betaproteobacteria bacterium]MDE2046979.1 tol-pal system-associated acyl-CoA thioesterase [Betaproteobacteria bacterium]